MDMISVFWELRSPWSNSPASPIWTKNNFKSKKKIFANLFSNKKKKKKGNNKKEKIVWINYWWLS